MAARSALNRFWRDESGATAVEIGVLMCLITVILITALTTIGGNIKIAFTKTANAIGS
nr:Flp family type IVb pilin [uncultured Caulobacter sp.]